MLHPWRQVVRKLCAYDLALPGGGWATRCRERTPDYEAGLPLVAAALVMTPAELPVPPPSALSPSSSLSEAQQLLLEQHSALPLVSTVYETYHADDMSTFGRMLKA